MKQPKGPVIKAIPIPANKALIKKSSNMIIAFGLLFHLENEYDHVYAHIKIRFEARSPNNSLYFRLEQQCVVCQNNTRVHLDILHDQ